MARRRNTSTTSTRQREQRRRERLAREDRIERITWFLLVLIFAAVYMIPEETSLPNWLVPLAGALVLLGSGTYQTSRRMRVSPVTWVAGIFMLFMTIFGLAYAPELDFLGFSLAIFAVVIGFGVVTGET